MDETYIKVKGKWGYLYRAVDKEGQTIDFMLSEKRDEPAARAFFNKAINSNGLPEKVTMDKSGANKAGVNTINVALALLCMFGGLPLQMTIRQIKYLNNIIVRILMNVNGDSADGERCYNFEIAGLVFKPKRSRSVNFFLFSHRISF